MKKIKKSLAVAAIAAIGCIAGVYGLQNSEKESKSALTIANIEALSVNENSDNQILIKCEGNCCVCAKTDDGSIIIHGHAKFIY